MKSYDVIVVLIFFSTLGYFLFSTLYVPHSSIDARLKRVHADVVAARDASDLNAAKLVVDVDNINNDDDDHDNNDDNKNKYKSKAKPNEPTTRSSRASSKSTRHNNADVGDASKTTKPVVGAGDAAADNDEPNAELLPVDRERTVMSVVNARLSAAATSTAKSRSTPPSQLLVLGMHHSGTSLLARALTYMGVFGGLTEDFHLMKSKFYPCNCLLLFFVFLFFLKKKKNCEKT